MAKRIYSIVANTVQNPLENAEVDSPRFEKTLVKLSTTPNTKTIVQPYGRQVAQHGHVVSIVRYEMLKFELFVAAKGKETITQSEVNEMIDIPFEPITTIVLHARDSFELQHIENLLSIANLNHEVFYDTEQPDYGNATDKVMTAIATYPLEPEDVVGILDYLPKWSAEN